MNECMLVTGDEVYCNPVPFSDGAVHTNPDPFILRWCGLYYCYASDEYGVKVSVSEDLVHWEDRGCAIREQEYHHYWAPSVIYLNGRFYMYYSNIPADETDCHEQHLKVAESDNPLGPFVWKKTFFDYFSIDSHPVFWGEKLYMFYSVNNWLGTEEKIAGTCILLDEMLTPYEFAGHPRAAVLPGISREIFEKNRFGDGRDWYTIEGACTVVHNGKIWLLYSANAYEHEDYFVGSSVADEKELLHEVKWRKYPDPYTWGPLLKRNDLVEGTGHNTVAKAPNLVDDWIVYHGRNAAEKLVIGLEQRSMRIDPLYYNGSQMICFGPSMWEKSSPLKPHIMVREQEVTADFLAGESPLAYRMECWIKAERSHCGARYGIYLDYRDERNYVEARLYSGQRKLVFLECLDGVLAELADWELPAHFDYQVPHLFLVQRNFNSFALWLDGRRAFTAETRRMGIGTEKGFLLRETGGRIGAASYFTRTTVCSMAMTVHAELEGIQLQNISTFYEFSYGTVNDDGLFFNKEEMVLKERERDENYAEEIEFMIDGEWPSIQTNRGDTVLVRRILSPENDGRRQFSLNHIVSRNQEWILLDGKPMPVVQKGNGIFSIRMQGLKIIRYHYTKI